MARVLDNLKLLLELTKARIGMLSTSSTAAGYLAAGRGNSADLGGPALGVFLLASGSLALNQYQERELDAVMTRTSRRPLPSGRVSPLAALIVSLSLIAAGLWIIRATGGPVAAALGAFTLFWYNAVYTPLKRATAFAAVLGSIVGAVPPLIGYTSAGGSPGEPAALAIAAFFFIWQIPHFWLLLFGLGRQYEEAKFRSLTAVFAPGQLTRVTFMWIAASAVSCLFLPLFGAVRSPVAGIGLVAPAVLLVWRSAGLLKPDASDRSFRAAFMSINFYALIVMAILSVDRLLERSR